MTIVRNNTPKAQIYIGILPVFMQDWNHSHVHHVNTNVTVRLVWKRILLVCMMDWNLLSVKPVTPILPAKDVCKSIFPMFMMEKSHSNVNYVNTHVQQSTPLMYIWNQPMAIISLHAQNVTGNLPVKTLVVLNWPKENMKQIVRGLNYHNTLANLIVRKKVVNNLMMYVCGF